MAARTPSSGTSPPPAAKRQRADSSAASAASAAGAAGAPPRRPPLRVGLVGLGAIGSYVAEVFREGDALPQAALAAILVQRPRAEKPACCGEALLTHELDAFFAADWSVCVEAAGQPFVREHGRRVLEAGRDLLITSVGALTDDSLHEELLAAAKASGARLLIASGAMPGMDWMSSAALEEVTEATLEQRKRPEGWKGTPAEERVDLASLAEAATVFEGPAREAASLFPKNANIAAALALATVGLDRLVVRLVADPAVAGPTSRIKLRGRAGELSIEVKGAALSQRTSRIVPLAVVKALRNLSSSEFIGI